jgi:hypothetical protein
VQSQKRQKIDLQVDYPCPCGRKGRLVPIALTEAFGCNRCQHIFVVKDNGYVLEQLSTTYPYKKAWYWTGHRWLGAYADLREQYIPILLTLILIAAIVVMVGALLYIYTISSAPWPMIVGLLLIVSFILLLFYRH